MAAACTFLNHQKLINDMYETCLDLRNCGNDCSLNHTTFPTCSYEIKCVFFDIRSPYLMDTQAESRVCGENRRKRRKKVDINNKNSEYHNKICEQIAKCDQSWKTHCLPDEPSQEEILLNNIFPRTAAKIIDNNCELSKLCVRSVKQEKKSILSITNNGHSTSNIDFANKLITHNDENACVITWNSKDYLIPVKSSFLLSKDLNILAETDRKYDCIIIDPPWNNKSLKRKHCYNTSPETEFLDLPIRKLSTKNCLIGVWTTNNNGLINFVKSQLFPHWGVEYAADWHWLKVTQYGELVVPLGNHTKRPYENLILGRTIDKTVTSVRKIPNNLIFVSVPSCFHSHKPLIKDLLKDFIDAEANCLEIFSRSLCTGWTSFGDEVK